MNKTRFASKAQLTIDRRSNVVSLVRDKIKDISPLIYPYARTQRDVFQLRLLRLSRSLACSSPASSSFDMHRDVPSSCSNRNERKHRSGFHLSALIIRCVIFIFFSLSLSHLPVVNTEQKGIVVFLRFTINSIKIISIELYTTRAVIRPDRQANWICF
jgi:hypothetical protein